MRILTATFHNFRNVPNGTYDLKGKNIVLVAENTFGKSNFMKGICATAGAISFGKDAIRHGYDKATIEVICSELKDWQPVPGTEYSFRALIEKKGEKEEVKLEAKAPNGFTEKKKTLIGSITGELELDYDIVELSKTKAGKAKQLEIFKSYLSDEDQQILRIEQNKIDTAYSERTEVGRKLTAVEGFLKEAGVLDPNDFKTYAEAIDTQSLLQKRDAAVKSNQKIEGVALRKGEREKRLVEINSNGEVNKKIVIVLDGTISEKAAIEKALGDLNEEEKKLTQENEQAIAWLSNNKPIDLSSIDMQLASANQHNEKHSQIKLLKSKMTEKESLESEYGDLTALVDGGRQVIEDALRDMAYPIEGISFDSENVYYKGKLIDQDNMSTAEIKMLEAQLKMCKAKGMEVLFVGSGESIGLKLLCELQQEANKHGMQIIMEEVKRGQEELLVELMPDYTIN